MEQATEVQAAPASRPAPPQEWRDTIRLEKTRGFSRVLVPRELWRYRDLAYQIAARDITVRYRQTALGAAWAVLQPVAFMVVFSLFFGRLAGVSSDGLPYALFNLTALVPWTFISTVVTLGADSLVMNNTLVSRIYFPRIFLPVGVAAAGLVDLAIAFVILMVIVTAWGFLPSPALLALPPLVLVLVATALGVSAALSALEVRYRDIRYVVPFGIQMWLFVSPVAYPSSLLHEPWRTISAINPMVGVIDGFRWAVLGGVEAPITLMAVSAASALLILLGGLFYFGRVERAFADLI